MEAAEIVPWVFLSFVLDVVLLLEEGNSDRKESLEGQRYPLGHNKPIRRQENHHRRCFIALQPTEYPKRAEDDLSVN